MPFDHFIIREQFPSLNRPVVFFDNPGGTQIARKSLDRIIAYLTLHNANHDGVFTTSRESDAILDEAHAAMADFLNAKRAGGNHLRQQHDYPDAAHQPLDFTLLESRG